MTTLVIAASVALFLLLALLLVSLNLFSLWKWWVKAAAIIVTLGSVVALYFSMTGIVGWASADKLPARFSLLHTRIVEPDKLSGTPGRIYLWIEEVDSRQVVISPPRAYEVAYEVETASDVATAQNQIDGGGKVLGQFAATGNDAPTKDIQPAEKGETVISIEAGARREGSPGGEGFETLGDPGALTFSEMPPVELPDKAVIELGR